jgi:PhnB protein
MAKPSSTKVPRKGSASRARTAPSAQAAAPRRRRKPPATAGASTETLVPVLAVEDAAAAIAWYKRAFGAAERDRRLTPEGKVVHAELALGGGRVYLVDVLPGAAADHPTSLGGTTVRLHLHVEKVDRTWARAVSEGAAVAIPLADQPWGERFGVLRDPFGHVWSMSRPVSAASPASRPDARAQPDPPRPEG